MKQLELTISERIFALAILNAFKGSHEKLAYVYEDIKSLPITEEEWTKAERVMEETSWRWSDEKGGLKSIEMHKEIAQYILDTINEKSKNEELTLQDRAALSLREKLV